MSDKHSDFKRVVIPMLLVVLAARGTAEAGKGMSQSRCDTPVNVANDCDNDAQRKEAQKEMTARQAEYREALKKQNTAQSKVNNLRAELDPLFKASQPYRKAALEVEASMKHSQAVHREEVETVRQSEPYEKQKAEHAAADVTIRRLADKVDFQDPMLQAALKARGKSASAMANLEAQVVLSNPRYLEATARSKAAEKQREDARKAFDAEQEKKPELAAALKALAQAHREAKEAEKAAEAAKDRFDKMLRL